MANITQKRRGKASHELTLRWVAGHEGIEGNETVDAEAKKAANGLTSSKLSLPAYLRKMLPQNPSAIRQHHNAKLNRTWATEWKDTKRGKAFLRLDKTAPSPSFLKRISNPTRSITQKAATSLIAQLAISHVPLNLYLHKFKLVDKPQCPACGNGKEDVEHYLLKCPAYAHERWALSKSAKKTKLLTMETLLSDQDLTIPLANFIKATHRFSQQTQLSSNVPQRADHTRSTPHPFRTFLTPLITYLLAQVGIVRGMVNPAGGG